MRMHSPPAARLHLTPNAAEPAIVTVSFCKRTCSLLLPVYVQLHVQVHSCCMPALTYRAADLYMLAAGTVHLRLVLSAQRRAPRLHSCLWCSEPAHSRELKSLPVHLLWSTSNLSTLLKVLIFTPCSLKTAWQASCTSPGTKSKLSCMCKMSSWIPICYCQHLQLPDRVMLHPACASQRSAVHCQNVACVHCSVGSALHAEQGGAHLQTGSAVDLITGTGNSAS